MLTSPPRCKMHDLDQPLIKAYEKSWCQSKEFAEIKDKRLIIHISKSVKLQKFIDRTTKKIKDKKNQPP